MRSLIIIAVAVVCIFDKCTAIRARRGVISEHHESGGGELGHGKHATSYQNIHIENYHPVPVYRKHGEESKHKIGSVSSNVHVNHGYGKHDPGHATVSGSVEEHGYGKESESLMVGGYGGGDEGHESFEGQAGYEGYGEGELGAAAQYTSELEGGGEEHGYKYGDQKGGYEQSILHQ